MKKMSDEKKCVLCLALVILMGFILFYTYIGDSQNQYEGIVRLHVLANSDTVEDQALKLKVRDAVIEYMEKQDDLNSAGEARKYLSENLNRLEKIAEGVIASEGYDYSARADLGVDVYKRQSLPGPKLPSRNTAIFSSDGRTPTTSWEFPADFFPTSSLTAENQASHSGSPSWEWKKKPRMVLFRWTNAEKRYMVTG